MSGPARMFERMDADIDRYLKTANQAVKMDEAAKQADEIRSTFEPVIAKVETPERVEKSDAERLMSMFTDYRERGLVGPGFDSEITMRALASTGGSAIPTTFIDQVTVYARTLSPQLDPNVVTV